jgi:hypothetical protein
MTERYGILFSCANSWKVGVPGVIDIDPDNELLESCDRRISLFTSSLRALSVLGVSAFSLHFFPLNPRRFDAPPKLRYLDPATEAPCRAASMPICECWSAASSHFNRSFPVPLLRQSRPTQRRKDGQRVASRMKRITSGRPSGSARRFVDTCAFLGINPTGELITVKNKISGRIVLARRVSLARHGPFAPLEGRPSGA